LRELRVGEAGEDFGDEEECGNDRQNREYPQKKLHAIADVQAEVTRDEGEDSSGE